MLKQLYFACAVVVLFPVSCVSPETYDYEYNGDLYFKILQHTPVDINEQQSHTLLLVTEENFNSVPNHLITEIEFSHREIEIHVLSIDRSESRYHAIGPAEAEISLPILNENALELKIQNKKSADRYYLTFNNGSIAVVVVDTSYTRYLQYDDSIGP